MPPRSREAPRRTTLVRMIFAVLAIGAVVWAGRDIATQWRGFRDSGGHLSLHPLPILGSGVLVLIAYAVLIQTWRAMVSAAGERLTLRSAAYIWFVSNLGRYVPGKIWQIGAMGVLAQRAGVSPAVAIGSSLVVNLVNLLVGFGVAIVTGAEFTGARGIAYVLALALVAGIAALPLGMPWAAKIAGRISGRSITIPTFPARSLWLTALGCCVAWLAYGFAFRMLVAGVLGSAPGRATSYIAAFTGSYLLGYIALFSPGGIGVREGALSVMLKQVALPVAGSAGIIAIASRLWLTVLEVLPGLILLLHDAVVTDRAPAKNNSTN